jgi:glutathione synthase/RimK-type ligase-like ATP-grasp enzyme
MAEKLIGVLLSDKIFQGIPKGKTRFENIEFYEEAGKMYGLTPCFFRLKDISKGVTEINAFVKKDGSYKKTAVPTPKVIHNRVHTFSKKAKVKLQRLVDDGIIIFNRCNRYSKLKIHQLLAENEELIPYLPRTLKATEKNIFSMLENNHKLIIKPNSSSLGIGVMLIERRNSENVLSYYDKKEKRLKQISFSSDLPNVLIKTISKKNYLVQERIQLATFQGDPFDLRVSVQRNLQGAWQVTGVVGKVAKSGHFVTNVARGGRVSQLDRLLEGRLDYGETVQKIEQLSVSIARQLAKKLPQLADLGLDIGLTSNGDPMFIECNGRDYRITFRNAMMLDTWKATYSTPIGYGNYLLNR